MMRGQQGFEELVREREWEWELMREEKRMDDEARLVSERPGGEWLGRKVKRRRSAEHYLLLVGAGLTLVAVGLALFLVWFTSDAGARKVHWYRTGASVFGGPRDASSGCVGYRGDDLCSWKGRYAFAELGMGCGGGAGLLGGLPYRAKIRVLYRHRKVTLRKFDCGLGGGRVFGVARGLDLWHAAAARLGMPYGTAVVSWRRVK